VQALAAFQKDAATITGAGGALGLHELCRSGRHTSWSVKMLDFLTEKYTESVFTADAQGRLPLHLLCGAPGHTQYTVQMYNKLISMLVEKGQVPSNIPSIDGMLPLDVLCRADGHSEYSVQMFVDLYAQQHASIQNVSAAALDSNDVSLIESSEKGPEQDGSDEKLIIRQGTNGDDAAQPEGGSGSIHDPETRQKDGKLGQKSDDVNSSSIRKHSEQGGKIKEGAHDGEADLAGATSKQRFSQLGAGSIFTMPLKNRKKNPLHLLCASRGHTEHSAVICRHLLQDNPVMTYEQDNDGLLPLHILTRSEELTDSSVEMSRQILNESSSLTVQDITKALGFLCETKLTSCSVHFCQILLGALETATQACPTPTERGNSVISPASRDGSKLRSEESGLPNKSPPETLQTKASLRVKMDAIHGTKASSTCNPAPESNARSTRELQFHLSTNLASHASDKDAQSIPLHSLCLSGHHTELTCQICELLLQARPDWVTASGAGGTQALHNLCACTAHNDYSLKIAERILSAHRDAAICVDDAGLLPLHVLCKNLSHTEHSVTICGLIMEAHADGCSQQTVGGLLPLHLMCDSTSVSEYSVQICQQILEAYSEGAGQSGIGQDLDLPIHRLCNAHPHTKHSVALCKMLVSACTESLARRGRSGDVPLIVLCRCPVLTKYSSFLCAELVDLNDDNLATHALSVLYPRVYRHSGSEEEERFATRMMMQLSFTTIDKAAEYIIFDQDAAAGPKSLNFIKQVLDEMGKDSSNPLHHVLRVAQLFKRLSQKQSSVALTARLSSLSNTYLQWANDIVDAMTAQVHTHTHTHTQTHTLMQTLPRYCQAFDLVAYILAVVKRHRYMQSFKRIYRCKGCTKAT
jgi:hypothetical protein